LTNLSQKKELMRDNDSNFGVLSNNRCVNNDSLWTGRSSSTTDCSSSPISEYSPRPVCNDCTMPAELVSRSSDERRLDRSISDVARLSNVVDTNVIPDALRCTLATSDRYVHPSFDSSLSETWRFDRRYLVSPRLRSVI